MSRSSPGAVIRIPLEGAVDRDLEKVPLQTWDLCRFEPWTKKVDTVFHNLHFLFV